MWTRDMIETERGRFEVFRAGSGAPLCITHHYSAFDERGYYFADPFAEQFQVFLVNMKEAGASPSVEADVEMSMANAVLDLEAIRMALGFSRWGYAGHSTGGMIGLHYGVMHASSLNQLGISGAAAFALSKDSIYSNDHPFHERLIEIFQRLEGPATSAAERKQLMKEWVSQSLYQPERFDEYYAKPSSGAVVTKRLRYFSEVEMKHYDLRKELESVSVPTVVIGGVHDRQCPYPFSVEIAELVPDATLIPFAKSNHMAFLEEEKRFREVVQELAEAWR